MAIRIPKKPQFGASEVVLRDSDKVFGIARVYKVDNSKNAKLVWEQTTFVDCNGKAFYDKNGIPFQGKK